MLLGQPTDIQHIPTFAEVSVWTKVLKVHREYPLPFGSCGVASPETLACAVAAQQRKVVARGGIEPPTRGFSGGAIGNLSEPEKT